MKKQKKDLSARAFQRGYDAGLRAKSKDICPHTTSQRRQDWLAGWQTGRDDWLYGIVRFA